MCTKLANMLNTKRVVIKLGKAKNHSQKSHQNKDKKIKRKIKMPDLWKIQVMP